MGVISVFINDDQHELYKFYCKKKKITMTNDLKNHIFNVIKEDESKPKPQLDHLPSSLIEATNMVLDSGWCSNVKIIKGLQTVVSKGKKLSPAQKKVLERSFNEIFKQDIKITDDN